MGGGGGGCAQDLWAVVVLLVAGFWLVQSQNLSCNQNDLAALQGFMTGLQSAITGWATNSSTSTNSSCCNWPGITCNPNSGRVTKLKLSGLRLTGKIGESISGLDELSSLNLSRNFLKDTLPFSLFHLPKLQEIDLSFNDLIGSIPESINLPFLTSLNLSSNSLNSSIPAHICLNSTKIKSLSLSVNYFSGDLPPGLGNCSSLEHLCLGMNDLTGAIRDDIFGLRNLKLLGLQNNGFSGSLSSRISDLRSLERLDISSNNFSDIIPDVFERLPKFQFMIAHSNSFVGAIPPSLSNSPSVIQLNLRNNSLNGSILINCSAMISLVSLDLGTNKFNGNLPSNLPYCKRLANINLARNTFRGPVPESFKDFQGLSYLSLSNCSLTNITSSLQILRQCKNLTTLVLTLNFHGEMLPADPGLSFDNMKILIIANCRLSGSIPQWLTKSTKLQLLDLSWNHLNDTIPTWFDNFKDLFYLDLSNNSFTGEIPKSLTGLPGLISRDVPLDQPLLDFPFFMKRNVSERALQYNQLWSFPPLLDLSNNFLTGHIWPEFENLKKIHILDLKVNNLSGPIPSELSGMTSLETLDLSYNDISGTIPSSLINLTFMSKFNVAHNRLYGKIPTGGQFQTFPNSSFEGNDLCGDHGMPPCSKADQVPIEAPSKSRRNKEIIIGMSVGIGLGTTFILGLMFMIVLRAHRREEADPEKLEADTNDKDLEDIGTSLVILLQNKENCKELYLEDLMKSTNNFDQANIIGCGGFGLVYIAMLPDGRKVAIKRLSGDCGQMDREFQAEVEALSRALHPNLVHLQGYCMFKNDRLLIYSFMENGSLDYWLHEKLDGPASLDWERRLRIAQGAIRGLSYLHQSCEPHILHRDIKSSNILLDGNFEAHLADFGLARLILPYDTHVSTDLVGTLGYIPPEYGQAAVATYQGDVYSFGVVLLELLTGRRPMDMCKPRGCRDLISWVIEMKKENRESEVFDPFIYDKEHSKGLRRVLEIACLCLSESPKARPSTQQLVSWLDNVKVTS